MPPLDDVGTGSTIAAPSQPAQPASQAPAPSGNEGAAPAFDTEKALGTIEEGLFGEHGEFKPLDKGKVATPQEPKEPVDSKGDAVPKEPTAPGTQAPAVGATPAPRTWTKEGQEAWAAVPPAAQQEILRREQEIERGFTEIKGSRDIATGFQKMLEPYVGIMQKHNINPWNNMSTLLNAQAQLVFGTPEQKLQIVKDAINTAGIDLKALLTGEGPLMDERYGALQEQVRNLQAQLGGVSTAVVGRQTQELEQKVWAFAQDETAHPYFWDVAADIADLTRQNPSLSLEKAYETAVWSNPVTRQKAIEAQYAKAAEERTRKQAEHAVKARSATSVNVEGTTARSGTANADEDLETTIRNSLREIKSRA